MKYPLKLELRTDHVCKICSAYKNITVPATAGCFACQRSLCSSCHQKHLRLLPFHQPFLKTTTCDMIYCARHPKEIIHAYCHQCKANICVVCSHLLLWWTFNYLTYITVIIILCNKMMWCKRAGVVYQWWLLFYGVFATNWCCLNILVLCNL